MLRWVLRVTLAGALLAALGACEGGGMGMEFAEISEQDSELVFYGPGLDGGYRKFLRGDNAHFDTLTAGLYGPRRGGFPRAELLLDEASPGRHFVHARSLSAYVAELEFTKGRRITHGAEGNTNNAMGSIDYLAFTADTMPCVAFQQFMGTRDEGGLGDTLLSGFYCRAEGQPPITAGEATEIVKAVGHRRHGVPEPPKGWDDVGTGAEHAKKARARVQAHDFDGAIREYNEAIRLEPANADYYRRRGNVYGKKGDFDRAFGDYAEAIRIAPENVAAYNSRGLTYLKKREFDRALMDFNDAIRVDPESAVSFNNRCWAYGLMRRPEEALRDCNESLRLKPDVPATLDSRALAYWLMGDHDRARQDLERAREINSKFAPPRDRFRDFEDMF